jgi:hypothetical protein
VVNMAATSMSYRIFLSHRTARHAMTMIVGVLILI